ncbi:MAG: hypothetical protein SOR61_08690 [Evtepia sp.]|nr:hypothetical protein [Evtepia sp.]
MKEFLRELVEFIRMGKTVGIQGISLCPKEKKRGERRGDFHGEEKKTV